jgi:Ser/Thr protein kinase RdoA (MazF antagonist)
LLFLAWKFPALDGRQLSIQRCVDAESASDLIWTGQLHGFDLPEFAGWTDDGGHGRDSWAAVVRPTPALRTLREHGSVVAPDVLRKAERRINEGIALLPDVSPRLVHRDLHLDNALVAAGRFAGVIDFEIVREWGFPWDFSNRLNDVFGRYSGSRAPFLSGYQECASELPP